MTVEELIEELEDFPRDATIMLETRYNPTSQPISATQLIFERRTETAQSVIISDFPVSK